jgi:hypothetical protein
MYGRRSANCQRLEEISRTTHDVRLMDATSVGIVPG